MKIRKLLRHLMIFSRGFIRVRETNHSILLAFHHDSTHTLTLVHLMIYDAHLIYARMNLLQS